MTRRPASELHLSARGADLIADREGLRTTSYLDSRGILTIGIGHTSAAGPPAVTEAMTITPDKAMHIFANDNRRFRKEVIHRVTAPLDQHEFDALCSFLFNVGSPQFLGSTALRRLNAGDYAGCAEALLWWDKPPEIIPRRRAEHDQFLNLAHVARA
jgi:lysozyme